MYLLIKQKRDCPRANDMEGGLDVNRFARTCSELLLLQSERLLLMLGHDASLAEQRGEKWCERSERTKTTMMKPKLRTFRFSRQKNKHVKSHKRLKIKIYNYSHLTHTQSHSGQIATRKQRRSNGLHDTVHSPPPHDN